MEIIAILSILIYVYTLICIAREVFHIDRKTTLTDIHRNVHLSILLYLTLMYFFIPYWMYVRKGFPQGYSLDKIERDFILLLFSMTLAILTITRYIYKVRTESHLLLDLKKDLKRSITFKFTKETKFEVIVKQFVKEYKQKGIDVEIISDTNLNLEHLKYLKKGEVSIFSPNTFLEKVSNLIEHNYFYHNKGIVIFNMHEHLKLAETLTATDYDISLFLKYEGKKDLVEIIIEKGNTYTIPKGVKHAAILGQIGKIGLKWN